MPRVGTVVAGPARSEARGGPDGARSLTRGGIVQTAIETADEEGLNLLSMRGVAARMGGPVTSVYRYVASKEELLLLMVDVVMQQELHPPP